MKTIFVTGGAGFIGSCFVRMCIGERLARVVNLDALTYAGNMDALRSVMNSSDYHFVKGDVCDYELVAALLDQYKPDSVVHFAAETHVDRSIANCRPFVRTNAKGTVCLLEAARRYADGLPAVARIAFRFLHVSTDEVYGSVEPPDRFTEESPYNPSSPYSASKAAADHFVMAYHRTYGLPTLVTHSSNNYGPYQNPEKLIPLMIGKAMAGEPLPVYGDGTNIRDWLFVEDHCRALWRVLTAGQPGETYNIGGNCELTNLEVVEAIKEATGSSSTVVFVPDRPGHDRRYAIDAGKIQRELGWRPSVDFRSDIQKTVASLG